MTPTWRLTALAGCLGLATGAALVWHLRPPDVRVETHEVEVVRWRDREVVREVAGPVRVETETVTRWLPVEVGTSTVLAPVVRVHTVEERGTSTLYLSVRQEGSREVERATLTVPPPRPEWAVGAGLQLLPGRRVEVALERQIAGPVWIRAWALQPVAAEWPAVGMGVRVEF